MKIEKECKYCSNTFDCDIREHNRGNGEFCSLSCVAKYSNENKELLTLPCKHCGISFNTVSKNAKYCSRSCKQKNYRSTSKHMDRNQRTLMGKIRKLPCAICDWKETVRDVHHILPISEGGKNEESNLISLCPNHHRMAHRDLISQNDLLKAIENRTISSP